MRPSSRPGAHPGGLPLLQSECFAHLGVNGGGGLNRCFDGDDEPVANAFLLLEMPGVIHALDSDAERFIWVNEAYS